MKFSAGGYACLKLSILSDIFDNDICTSLRTISLDLYLVNILENVENAISHKYFVAKSSSISTRFIIIIRNIWNCASIANQII